MKVNKDFSYKDVKLLPYEEFKKRCKFFFDCYAGSENFDFIFNKGYYCGEGCSSFVIYSFDGKIKDININQCDYALEEHYDLWIGIEYISDFASLTSVFNYIIANDLLN